MMRLEAYDICLEFPIFCDEIKQVRHKDSFIEISGEMDRVP